MLIRVNRGELRGKLTTQSGKTKTLDFWKAPGVYAPYDDFRIAFYARQAANGKDGYLGSRLREHLTDQIAPLGYVSWFGTSSCAQP